MSTEPTIGAQRAADDGEPIDRSVAGWARAIWGGIVDTAKDVLDEGRKGAQSGYEEGWKRYDAKTRYRRQQAKKPRKS